MKAKLLMIVLCYSHPFQASNYISYDDISQYGACLGKRAEESIVQTDYVPTTTNPNIIYDLIHRCTFFKALFVIRR